MNNKFFNDAVIGNKSIRATFSKNGEMLRMYYPSIDYSQFIDMFHIGMKINDSAIVYLHEDINNKYEQYYTENTNILNTEIENSYFNLQVKQTDFVTIKNNELIRKYTFTNNNKIDLDLKFIARSRLLSDSNNMVSGKIIENGLIQYNHEYYVATFAKQNINGHRLNDVDNFIREAILEDKDYIGMSNDSAISYNIGILKPGEKAEFTLYILVEESGNFKNIDELEEKIINLKKLDNKKEYEQTKKYWNNYLSKHDSLKIDDSQNKSINPKVKDIYKRTILLFPLLRNEETGGISAAVEVDENLEKSGRYSYCWPRDAVFVTKALDILDMTKETEKFYDTFCKRTQSQNGMWEQRFYTDGTIAPCWGYQIDETSSVIFGIYEHYLKTKDIKFLANNLKMCENALNFLFKYLDNVFDKKEEEDIVKKEIEEMVKKSGKETDKIYKHPSYDLWEMNEGIHLYSLASIYAGLNAMEKIYEITKSKYENNRLKLEQISKNTLRIKSEINDIKKYVEKNLCDENTKILHRNTEDGKMDVSMIGTVYPFELLSPNEKKVLNTVEKINLTLRTYTSGYLRFEQDSYMDGKSPWPIATLWMAMYYLKSGSRKKALECFDFVTKSATELGFLSEQVDNSTMKPNWIIGLGWSHAMYIITLAEILKKS
mgnify:CR=1 FL=1